MTRIKIVHIITGLKTGGAESMLYKLLCGTDASQFESSVISLMDKGTFGERIEELGVRVFELGMSNKSFDFHSLPRFYKALKETEPDIIQGWMYHGNMAGIIGAWICGRRPALLWNVRHNVESLSYEKATTAAIIRLGALMTAWPRGIVFNSQRSLHRHTELGYKPDKARVIPNGFDCVRFKPDASARQHLESLTGIAGDALVIGLVGRYHPMKDQRNFLEAAARLCQTHPQVQYVMVGRGVSVDNPELWCHVQRLKLENVVHLLGERRDIAKLTASFDIATCSSYSEAFPNVVGEAMACGVPCVVTDVGDCAWIVSDTGLVVPPKDPGELARAFGSLIASGAQHRQELGKAARQRIVENFDIEHIVQRYENFYREISFAQCQPLPQGGAKII